MPSRVSQTKHWNANEALERSRTTSDALKYACHSWAMHLSRAPRPWDDTLNRIFQAFWNDHIISWLEMEWCLKGLQPCLSILSEGQKLAKFETVNAQPNKRLSAIDPDFHHSTREALTPASTSEMTNSGPSAPVTILFTEELVVTSHVRPTPNPRPSTKPRPSTSCLVPALPLVPPPRPTIAMLHIGTSRKHVSNEFRINSESQLQLDTPGLSKLYQQLLRFRPNRTV
ncbi:hypothetical protein BD769DRAFT_1677903 [Suillus cothurnatus]|nr:hypothetical protein BD769DRAFT_1677903 [Suillus cothurnatus]